MFNWAFLSPVENISETVENGEGVVSMPEGHQYIGYIAPSQILVGRADHGLIVHSAIGEKPQGLVVVSRLEA